ncbi:MAG TPA: hypothetical protein VI365_04855, partial [Trebonia sp.]
MEEQAADLRAGDAGAREDLGLQSPQRRPAGVVDGLQGAPGLRRGPRVVGQADQDLREHQVVGGAVVTGEDLQVALNALGQRAASDRGVGYGHVEPPRALLEHRQHQGFPGAEVVLDHAPGQAGLLGDRVRARPVQALLEDALDGGVQHPLPGRAVTRGLAPRATRRLRHLKPASPA